MPFCTKCGTNVAEGINFCTKCGNPMSGGASPSQSSVPSQRPRVQARQVAPVSTRAKGQTSAQKTWIIAAAVVLGLCIAFVIVKFAVIPKNHAVAFDDETTVKAAFIKMEKLLDEEYDENDFDEDEFKEFMDEYKASGMTLEVYIEAQQEAAIMAEAPRVLGSFESSLLAVVAEYGRKKFTTKDLIFQVPEDSKWFTYTVITDSKGKPVACHAVLKGSIGEFSGKLITEYDSGSDNFNHRVEPAEMTEKVRGMIPNFLR